jgi:hypothetical protein
MKVAFLTVGVMKVAFLNLDGRLSPIPWENFLGMWMRA